MASLRVRAGLLATCTGLAALVAWGTPPAGGVTRPPADDRTVAPELVGLGEWFNGKPTTLHALRGKVVLIDFWTFGCVNCQRTIPHLNALYAKHHRSGFEIIGVHSPEFGYEHDVANVRTAVADERIRFPVAMDNHFRTWRAYKNHWWPAFYLVDKNGAIRYTHIGEGAYDTMDEKVTKLLAERAAPARPVRT
jgi:thiol-disulfide isomerase/thioredoxin